MHTPITGRKAIVNALLELHVRILDNPSNSVLKICWEKPPSEDHPPLWVTLPPVLKGKILIGLKGSLSDYPPLRDLVRRSHPSVLRSAVVWEAYEGFPIDIALSPYYEFYIET